MKGDCAGKRRLRLDWDADWRAKVKWPKRFTTQRPHPGCTNLILSLGGAPSFVSTLSHLPQCFRAGGGIITATRHAITTTRHPPRTLR